MTKYNSINTVKSKININELGISNELIDLLGLLEEVNPCNQSYDYMDNSFVISYKLRLNLFNFFGKLKLYKNTRIVGLPISICDKEYYGDKNTISNIIKTKKGLTIVLNANSDLGCKSKTLSTFIFCNRYKNVEDYLKSLRSNYRRRINKALKNREKLIIENIDNLDFTDDHYMLYKSVMDRTDNPLETLPIEFFRKYDSNISEFRDKKTNRLLAFIQTKEIGDTLYFLFCGFKKEDNDYYDLYYNMLIKILEIGFDKQSKKINFGQTSEESKLKIGCIEESKYLCIYHSNKVINAILQWLAPLFSYKPYVTKHKVFKNQK